DDIHEPNIDFQLTGDDGNRQQNGDQKDQTNARHVAKTSGRSVTHFDSQLPLKKANLFSERLKISVVKPSRSGYLMYPRVQPEKGPPATEPRVTRFPK